MNPLTEEWVQKAEGDWLTASRELMAQPPNYDATCFHAQQCAEKYLKALLQERMVAFPKTHDLEELIDLLLPDMPDLREWRAFAKSLSELAVELRYPGAWPGADDAREAVEQCKIIRNEIRSRLGLATAET